MSVLQQPLFLIRKVGTEDYEAGYGSYAVPKLYTRSSVNSVVGRKNKQAAQHSWASRWEAVPVRVVIDVPTLEGA